MATSNFAFEVRAILGLESTHLEIRVTKIGCIYRTSKFAFLVPKLEAPAAPAAPAAPSVQATINAQCAAWVSHLFILFLI